MAGLQVGFMDLTPSASFSPLTTGSPTHVWWADGPEMQALAYANGAVVSTWPDEVGAADAVVNTALYAGSVGPRFVSSAAVLGNNAALSNTGGTHSAFCRMVTSSLPAPVSQPFDVVAVLYSAGRGDLLAHHPLNGNHHNVFTTSFGAGFQAAVDFGVTFSSGVGIVDGSPHFLRFRLDTTDETFVDEVAGATGNAGANGYSRVVFFNGQFAFDGYVAFVGIYDTPLSTADITALHEWAQDTYGTP